MCIEKVSFFQIVKFRTSNKYLKNALQNKYFQKRTISLQKVHKSINILPHNESYETKIFPEA